MFATHLFKRIFFLKKGVGIKHDMTYSQASLQPDKHSLTTLSEIDRSEKNIFLLKYLKKN